MVDAQERIGQSFGDYRLLSLLSKGRFGTVYIAEHLYEHTSAAVKVLHTPLTGPNDFDVFLKETRTVRLQHPHIVSLFDFEQGRDSLPYLAMTYAAGGSLRDRYPQGSILPYETIDTYVQQVAAALQYAHDCHVIHYDVKPENMLMSSDGIVQLSDFSIAKISRQTNLQTQPKVIGTPAYTAPEQSQGDPCPASDQYALAIVVYEWLTGQCPFQGDPFAVASQHQTEPPPSLGNINPEVSPQLEQVIFKALAKAPKERYPTITYFADALHAALLEDDEPTQIHPKAKRGDNQDTPLQVSDGVPSELSPSEEVQSSNNTQDISQYETAPMAPVSSSDAPSQQPLPAELPPAPADIPVPAQPVFTSLPNVSTPDMDEFHNAQTMQQPQYLYQPMSGRINLKHRPDYLRTAGLAAIGARLASIRARLASTTVGAGLASIRARLASTTVGAGLASIRAKLVSTGAEARLASIRARLASTSVEARLASIRARLASTSVEARLASIRASLASNRRLATTRKLASASVKAFFERRSISSTIAKDRLKKTVQHQAVDGKFAQQSHTSARPVQSQQALPTWVRIIGSFSIVIIVGGCFSILLHLLPTLFASPTQKSGVTPATHVATQYQVRKPTLASQDQKMPTPTPAPTPIPSPQHPTPTPTPPVISPAIAAGPLLYSTPDPFAACDKLGGHWTDASGAHVICNANGSEMVNTSGNLAVANLDQLGGNQSPWPGQDYIVQVQVTLNPNSGGGLGIDFQPVGNDNAQAYFAYVLTPPANWAFNYYGTPGNLTNSLVYAPLISPVPTQFTIDIRVAGTFYTFYINGQDTTGFAETGSQYINKIAGLAVDAGADVTFSNFAVFALP